ncbi:hypothetical protein ACFXJ6_25155 [Streptomyces sp. NPDC059218]|uniref:hypothetical protein n=1 Tax=unclassified Streptomyces TaxID=2593676 RepID=UPI0036BABA8D
MSGVLVALALAGERADDEDDKDEQLGRDVRLLEFPLPDEVLHAVWLRTVADRLAAEPSPEYGYSCVPGSRLTGSAV